MEEEQFLKKLDIFGWFQFLVIVTNAMNMSVQRTPPDPALNSFKYSQAVLLT